MAKQSKTVLYIFGGLPGTGKSELAKYIAQTRRAVYLRIDGIEQAIRASQKSVVGPEGYEVAYRVAKDNLSNGVSVVADSVNPIEITRSAWRNVAMEAQVEFRQIEVKCSDPTGHRRRVESRRPAVPGLRLPNWEEVIQREYEPRNNIDVVIDTAGETPEAGEFSRALRVTRREPLRMQSMEPSDQPLENRTTYTVVTPDRDRRSQFRETAIAYRKAKRAINVVVGIGFLFWLLAAFVPAARLLGVAGFLLCLMIIAFCSVAFLELPCPMCQKNAENERNQFCPECGSQAIESGLWGLRAPTCLDCGKSLARSRGGRRYKIRFCGHCGAFLDDKGL